MRYLRIPATLALGLLLACGSGNQVANSTEPAKNFQRPLSNSDVDSNEFIALCDGANRVYLFHYGEAVSVAVIPLSRECGFNG